MLNLKINKPTLKLGKCGCYNFYSCKGCPFKQTILCETFSFMIQQGYPNFNDCVVALTSLLLRLHKDMEEEKEVDIVVYRNYDFYLDKYGNLKNFDRKGVYKK